MAVLTGLAELELMKTVVMVAVAMRRRCDPTYRRLSVVARFTRGRRSVLSRMPMLPRYEPEPDAGGSGGEMVPPTCAQWYG